MREVRLILERLQTGLFLLGDRSVESILQMTVEDMMRDCSVWVEVLSDEIPEATTTRPVVTVES